jgi:hypothetical protein
VGRSFPPTSPLRSTDLPYLVLSRLSVSGRLLRYVSRMVKVTTLAPDIEPATLDETVPPDLTPFDHGVCKPAVWEE